jgi:NAD(P)H dehydrogenase (quinone)
MNVLIVFAHPEPASLNGALFDTALRELRAAGHTVVTSDLYRMGFDPVSSRRNFTTVKDAGYLKLQVEETHASEHDGFAAEIEAEIRKLEACDLLVLQFPLWWFGLPAMLKGWVDRVLAMGRTYGYGAIYETGKFKGKRALLSLTTGGPEEAYRKGGFNGDIAASCARSSAACCSSSASTCWRRRSTTARCGPARSSARPGWRTMQSGWAPSRRRGRSRWGRIEGAG